MSSLASPSGPKIFAMPHAKGFNRPGTWFSSGNAEPGPSHSPQTLCLPDMGMRALGPTSSSSSSGSTADSLSSSTASSNHAAAFIPESPANPFAPKQAGRNKHKLSPSPSPRRDEDFVMISPVRPMYAFSPHGPSDGSSPIEDSPTPACNMASAAARLRLADDDSPIRRVPGQSRSLGGAKASRESLGDRRGIPASPLKLHSTRGMMDFSDGEVSPVPDTPYGREAPVPQPLFPLPRSRSAEIKAALEAKQGRLGAPQNRVRASTQSGMSMPPPTILGQKKAISLDRIAQAGDRDEAFGSVAAPAAAMGHARRQSRGQIHPGLLSRHKRVNSSESNASASISRSTGHKSGLSLTLNNLPDFSTSNSSLSSMATTNVTPPASHFSPAAFDNVRPLQEAFEQPAGTLLRKFKPRDSGVALEEPKQPPPSVLRPSAYKTRRPPMLKRTSSMGDDRPMETPLEPSGESGWPRVAPTFGFLGDSGFAIAAARAEDKTSMPGTPVKKGHGGRQGMGHSTSHPSLSRHAYEHTLHEVEENVPQPVPQLTLTGADSSSPSGEGSSPTVRVAKDKGIAAPPMRVSMLRRTDSDGSSSESDSSPSKGERIDYQNTPSKPPPPVRANKSQATVYPRMSLPAFANPKVHRTLHHRQSHPATRPQEGEDIFETRFITLETLGKGAFSTVIKVQDREGEGLWAVKKARGVFDGVRDRLRHLEEVDILRLLSNPSNPHVLRFESAWEQNRQLFIQTELCLGTLAFFLEEYGRVVERLDEGRVWKIVRELSDGLNHIHSNGVIHFDLKPANILIDGKGAIKIGDFGLASRYPRVSPADILKGSGLGGSVALLGSSAAGWEKMDREGDRQYMPPEMLRGVFGMPADIYSFGVVILEVSTNICVPDGGPAWHALRSDDFTVIDLSPLSPALTDMITSCMAADPARRPRVEHIVQHPVVVRARSGREALAPEAREWVVQVLGGGFQVPVPQTAAGLAMVAAAAAGGAGAGSGDVEEAGEGDVEMLE